MSTDGSDLRGNWNYPTSIRFGAGRIRELPEACAELGIQRPLLITDAGLAELPMVPEALSINEQAGLQTGLFSEVRENPSGKNVDDGVLAFKGGRHDGVIAFGGGSALDAAKAVALMVGQERPLWDFEDVADWYTRVDVAGMVPVVAVPTTSGTGSEVGRASLIVDEASHKKKVIFHPRMLPGVVICDPELTVGMPPKLTGAVGMDALSHSLEAFCSPLFHPMADGIAVEGMRLVHESLRKACQEGEDIEARVKMMAASSMGATAFQKGLGAMHAVAHAIGGVMPVHHGTTVAVMMPYVLRLNRDAITNKMARLAAFLGLSNPGFETVLDWALTLRRDVGIPHTLADLGVSRDDIPEFAKNAALDPTAGTNPVPLTEENLSALVTNALTGKDTRER
jgi:alcohol dehydrogenase class IV